MSNSVSNVRTRTKKALVVAFGSKCQICGLIDEDCVYDFHHIDAEKKEFGLSNGNTRSKEKTAHEAKKCALLCANCHRKIEQGTLIKNLTSNFNEELFYTEYNSMLKVKPRKEHFCEKCGIKITYNCNLCVKCSSENKRVVERPSREELKQMIREMPFTHIGKKFGVSDNAIRKWCDNYNLPRKVSAIQDIVDEEWRLI